MIDKEEAKYFDERIEEKIDELRDLLYRIKEKFVSKDRVAQILVNLESGVNVASSELSQETYNKLHGEILRYEREMQ